MVYGIERPPKPIVSETHCNEGDGLEKGDEKGIMEEDTIHELPKGEDGEYIFPEDAIGMRLFEILDFK
jgi:hypothetical protein